MVLSAILVSVLIFTFQSEIGIDKNEVKNMEMCKLDQHGDGLASSPNVTTVENPDITYVTCIHHTDGIHDYYNVSIPAKDCKPPKKYVEMNEEKVELDKDVCPVPGRWPKCDITEFIVTLPIPTIIPPAQPSLWYSLTSHVVHILDYFTMPTVTWRTKMQDRLRYEGVQHKHLYKGTRIEPAADASVNTIQLMILDSDQEHHDGDTFIPHDENYDFGFDTTTPRSKSTSGTDQQAKPNRREHMHHVNYVRRNLKTGSTRRRSGRGEWKLLYEQIYATLHAYYGSTPSPVTIQMKDDISTVVSKTTERVLRIYRKMAQIIFLNARVVVAFAVCLVAQVIVFRIITKKYCTRKQSERQREQSLNTGTTQNRGNNGRKQQQKRKKKKKQSKHIF